MNDNITTDDISILGQHIKNLDLEIELLNQDLQTIDILSGDPIELSYDYDSSSDCRASCTLKMFVKNSNYTIDDGSKIWLNRYIKIWIKILSQRTKQWLKYCIGLFMPLNNDFTYSDTDRLLECKCADLMTILTNTQLGGAETTTISADTNIRSSMIGTITQLGGIKKYYIENIGSLQSEGNNTVPYDLTFNCGDSVYDVVEKLRDLYSGWQTYFDLDTFMCTSIPTNTNSNIILDYQTIIDKALVIDEKLSNDFTKVKNVTEVFGSTIDVDDGRYTDTCTLSGSQYIATFSSTIDALESGGKYAVKLPSANLANPTLKIDSLTAYSIVDSDGTSLSAGTIDGYSVFEWKNNLFYYLGKYQCHAVCIYRGTQPTDTEKTTDKTTYNCDTIGYRINPDGIFTIEKIGIKKDVKTGSNYDVIYSNDLCLERAKYENWKTVRLANTLELTMQLVPWLQVNQLITYQLKSTGDIKTWTVTKISCSNALSGTMTVELTEYYPDYPESYL